MRKATWWAVGAVSALALLTLVIRALPDTAPESDFALIDLQVFSTLHHIQPVGAYSRFGWNHPGPLFFQALAPLYWLTGYRHLSVLVTAAVLNVASLAILVAILRRLAGPGLLAAACALFGVYLERAWGLLSSPWNAHVPILPLAALVGCAAAAGAGAVWFLPAAIALASLTIQAHVGFTLPSVVPVAGALVLTGLNGFRARRTGAAPPSGLGRALLVSGLLGITLWALPVADELSPDGLHNARRIYAFVRDMPHMGGRDANRTFVHYYVAPFAPTLELPWGAVLRPPREAVVRVLAQAQGLLLIGAVWWWHRRQRRFETVFAGLTLAASGAALLAIRRLDSGPNDHTVYWVSVLGVLSWSVIVALPIEAAFAMLGHAARVTSLIRAWLPRLAIAAAIATASWQVWERQQTFVRGSAPIRALTGVVRAELDRSGAHSPLLPVNQEFWSPIAGVVLQLALSGFDPHVDTERVTMFGRWLAPTGRESPVFHFAGHEVRIDDPDYRPDLRYCGSANGVFVYVEQVRPAAAPAPAAPGR